MRVVESVIEVGDVDAFVATLSDIGDEYDCAVQAFDADYVAGRPHLDSAVQHANRAFDRGENVARDRSVEILLYAAGRRQIQRALEMGVSAGQTRAVVVVDGDDEASAVDALGDVDAFGDVITSDATVDGGDEGVLTAFFEISAAERAASDASLSDLVCERVALLDVEK